MKVSRDKFLTKPIRFVCVCVSVYACVQVKCNVVNDRENLGFNMHTIYFVRYTSLTRFDVIYALAVNDFHNALLMLHHINITSQPYVYAMYVYIYIYILIRFPFWDVKVSEVREVYAFNLQISIIWNFKSLSKNCYCYCVHKHFCSVFLSINRFAVLLLVSANDSCYFYIAVQRFSSQTASELRALATKRSTFVPLLFSPFVVAVAVAFAVGRRRCRQYQSN